MRRTTYGPHLCYSSESAVERAKTCTVLFISSVRWKDRQWHNCNVPLRLAVILKCCPTELTHIQAILFRCQNKSNVMTRLITSNRIISVLSFYIVSDIFSDLSLNLTRCLVTVMYEKQEWYINTFWFIGEDTDLPLLIFACNLGVKGTGISLARKNTLGISPVKCNLATRDP